MVEGKEIGVVGRAIYQKLLPRLADTAKKGQIVVIDINSGDYEIADDDITATGLVAEAAAGRDDLGRASRLSCSLPDERQVDVRGRTGRSAGQISCVRGDRGALLRVARRHSARAFR